MLKVGRQYAQHTRSRKRTAAHNGVTSASPGDHHPELQPTAYQAVTTEPRGCVFDYIWLKPCCTTHHHQLRCRFASAPLLPPPLSEFLLSLLLRSRLRLLLRLRDDFLLLLALLRGSLPLSLLLRRSRDLLLLLREDRPAPAPPLPLLLSLSLDLSASRPPSLLLLLPRSLLRLRLRLRLRRLASLSLSLSLSPSLPRSCSLSRCFASRSLSWSLLLCSLPRLSASPRRLSLSPSRLSLAALVLPSSPRPPPPPPLSLSLSRSLPLSLLLLRRRLRSPGLRERLLLRSLWDAPLALPLWPPPL
jgi:hypothetical protein